MEKREEKKEEEEGGRVKKIHIGNKNKTEYKNKEKKERNSEKRLKERR